jgi:DGQHR domain-containing protein
MNDIPARVVAGLAGVEDIDQSNKYTSLIGRFLTGKSAIPYAVFNMTLSQAAADLVIPEEAAPVSIRDAKLSHLYQREIDWKRVKMGLVPYLMNENTEHFFSALTVMLVPFRGGRFVNFESEGMKAPAAHAGNPSEAIGSIRLTSMDGEPINLQNISFGVIQWNRDQVRAIAIDGQHRLGALKVLKQQNFSKLAHSKITVVAVIPSLALGYSAASSGPPYELMRKLFTDLNTHAVRVDDTRQLLLDDEDPFRLCVRAVLDDVFVDYNAMMPAQSRIPLPLIDWHTGEGKVEGGPYILSVATLQAFVRLLTETDTVSDWGNPASVEKQVNSFRRLGWAPSQECEGRLRTVREFEENSPFSYPEEDLHAIQEAFRNRWGEAVVTLFTHVAPYQRLIWRRAATPGGLASGFTQWYAAVHRKESAKREIAELTSAVDSVRTMLLHQTPPVNVDTFAQMRSDVDALKGDSLAFKIVFQKALVLALKTLAAYPSLDPEANGSASPQVFWARRMVSALNHLSQVSEGDFFHKDFSDAKQRAHFWAGSCRNFDGSIDYQGAAAKRTQWWLVLATLMHYGMTESPAAERFRITERVDRVHVEPGERANPFDGTLGVRYAAAVRALVESNQQRPMYKVCAFKFDGAFPFEDDEERTERVLWDEMRARLVLLFSRLSASS